ncbi:MAG: hypothetical protein AMS27_07570 [Bacteroides sp. SM23_62_1]|nr:MAG: hypothetical protein AMS27_07570 [Bacteroides sp. SM23_62_1]
MIIAQEKRRTNIAEFILYMWQLEDLIRGSQFDIEEIEQNIIRKFRQPVEIKYEIRDWYINLIQMMKQERIEQQGHLSFVNNLMADVSQLHMRYIHNSDDSEYHLLYYQAKPNIQALIDKSGHDRMSEIEACLTGLYGFFLMRLQNKEISRETTDAMATISNLMAALSKRFREIEAGERELP